MGQSAGGALQGGAPGAPGGYQPSELGKLQAACSRQVYDDGAWGGGGASSFTPTPPAHAQEAPFGDEQRKLVRLASFNTDVDAVSNVSQSFPQHGASTAYADGYGGGSPQGAYAAPTYRGDYGRPLPPAASSPLASGAHSGHSHSHGGFDGGSGDAGRRNMPYPATNAFSTDASGAGAGGFGESERAARGRDFGGPSQPMETMGEARGPWASSHSAAASMRSDWEPGRGVGALGTGALGGGSSMGAGMSAPSPWSSQMSVATASGPGRHGGADGGGTRETWEEGSIVEVYSATLGRWYPARVMKAELADEGADVLTVQFSTDDGLKIKAMYRSDAMLSPFGTHLHGELPPGFQRRPSQSRPGQVTFLDATTGRKYASDDLAWRVHLERLIEQPAAGLYTVCAVPSSASSAVASQCIRPQNRFNAQDDYDYDAMSSVSSASAPVLARGPRPGDHVAMAAANLASAAGGGKVSLPRFGEFNPRQSNQAAYLGFVGTPGQGGVGGQGGGGGTTSEEDRSQYPTPQGARATAQRRPPPRAVNPQLQVWQEDPFSEWRG